MRLARAGAVCVAALLVAPCLAGDDPFPNLILKRDLHTSRASRPPVEGTQARMEAAFGELAVGFDCGTHPSCSVSGAAPPRRSSTFSPSPRRWPKRRSGSGPTGAWRPLHIRQEQRRRGSHPSTATGTAFPIMWKAVAAGVSDALAAAERAGFQPRAGGRGRVRGRTSRDSEGVHGARAAPGERASRFSCSTHASTVTRRS